MAESSKNVPVSSVNSIPNLVIEGLSTDLAEVTAREIDERGVAVDVPVTVAIPERIAPARQIEVDQRSDG